MFVYFGRNFNAATSASTIVGVRCEKCNCEYYYEFARVGRGDATAPYAIGSGLAKDFADKRAARDLEDRLKQEAELVPCPKCHWISEALVQGYRRGKYRGLSSFKTIASILMLGILPTLVFAWFFSNGDPRDRYLVPYFLYGGPAVVVAFAVSLVLLQYFLRRLIQPNRLFPLPPKVPPGTPPALFGDPEHGEFRPAKADTPMNEWHEFQVGRTVFPLVCCNCMRPATTEYAFRIPLDEITALEIPMCAPCNAKPASSPGRFWLFVLAFVCLVAGMGLTFSFATADYSTWINFGLLILFFGTVALIVKTWNPPTPVEAEVVDCSRGVVRVRFRNAAYGRLVAEQAKDNYQGTIDSVVQATTAIEAELPHRHGVKGPESPE